MNWRDPINMARRPFLVIVLAAACLVWAAAASAQLSNWVSVTGTATAPGKIKRSIIDITKPGYIQAVGRARALDAIPNQGQATTVITVPVLTGETSATWCHAYRDSALAALAPLGYLVAYVSNPPIPNTVEIVKTVGTFTVLDSVSAPGMTFTTKFVSLNNGPALTPGWAEALVGLLAASAFLLRRRRLHPAKIRGR